jgi:hypothetical protein
MLYILPINCHFFIKGVLTVFSYHALIYFRVNDVFC